MKIKIIDMPMGEGKTTGMINYMNNHPENKYMFITPFLDEVQRIKENCPNLNFREPDGKYSKLADLKNLIAEGENIVSTHALFSIIDKQTVELIKMNDYILILDEVLEIIEPLGLSSRDIKLLLDDNIIKVEDDDRVTLSTSIYSGRNNKFNKEIEIIKNQNVYYIDNTLLICLFNPNTISVFDKVYILTYLFDGSLMKAYFNLFHLKYQYCRIKNNQIINGKFDDTEFRIKVRELITIYNGKFNLIGEKKTALSAKWYKDNKKREEHIVLKKNIYNYFHNISKVKNEEAMWSTFIGYNENCKDFYTPTGYKKGTFVPCNIRATNNFSHKKSLIYAVNVFINPYICKYFSNRNIGIDGDLYAISQLLQWIWRSQIRNGKPIDIYIPSKRMRDLFIEYLNDASE